MLKKGQTAPDFALERLEGGRAALREILGQGPAALVFFKVGCPTCQLALPLLDRLSDSELPVYAVSQDDAARTREFLRHFPVRLPMLLDSAAAGYPASAAYGIRYVPSLFVIEPHGAITETCEAFDRRVYEQLGRRAGRVVIQPGESVPLYQPG